MGILSRRIFREILSGSFLGITLFTFVLFLQQVGRLFELLVRSSATPVVAARLFGLILPPALTFTVPVGILVGVLLALSRMSSDGEITALRAAGIPSQRVLFPVIACSILGTVLTAAATLWLTPWSIREAIRIQNRLAASELTALIQPRVFEEQFPNRILYVGDVLAGPIVRWRKVFLADLSPASGRKTEGGEQAEGPLITVAQEAIAVPDVANNRIQLSMTNGYTYQAGKPSGGVAAKGLLPYYYGTFPRGVQVLTAKPPEEKKARPYREIDTIPLLHLAKDSIDARIELHQRLALPLACILLAIVGVPLGVSVRKGGKSAALVLTVFLAFLYYMGLISLINLARQNALPASLAVWLPNIVFALTGVVLVARLERPGEGSFLTATRAFFASELLRLQSKWRSAPVMWNNGRFEARLFLLPQLLDTYVLSGFFQYFTLFLVSFVVMTHVYTFFELLGDIIKNNIPIGKVATYHLFLTPKLIYDSAPVSVMVAVLVTFGVLTKHNEVIAFRACGVSLHRLVTPVLVASSLLSAALFAFDYYYIPEANRKQDAIRNEIKGRPVQTYLRPDRKWIFGKGSRIYYYLYFDAVEQLMAGVSVYELDPRTFQMTRHISAERARWSSNLKTWVFENGWAADVSSGGKVTSQMFEATTFRELDEPPNYFLKEVKQDKQMNFHELAAYITELQQGGFDTVRLRVQFYKKFSAPLFALILAMISAPLAFLTGSRGALAGVGVSFAIAIAYWSVEQLFQQIGNMNQLPPALAAWSPNALFCLAGSYLLARLRT
jgi:LPS export ABC transporter permease LptG/LPS export ABC transporter permease LptF